MFAIREMAKIPLFLAKQQPSSLWKCFLNFNMLNNLSILLKLFCSKVWSGTWDCSFVVSTQVMSLLEVQTTLWITGPCCCCSVTQSCPTLCNPMNCSTPGLPVLHHLPEFAQVHVHCISDAIQLSHPVMTSFLSALNLSQHQGLFHDLAVHIRWPKYWSFSFSISPSTEYSGLISFKINCFDLLAVQWTLKSLLQHIVQRHQFFATLPSLQSSSHNCTWPLRRPQPWLYGPLSAEWCVCFSTHCLVIAFLPRSNHLLISWLQSPSTVILEPNKRESVTASTFSPSICHDLMGPDTMILIFLKYLVLSQLFHSPSSPSSKGFLVIFLSFCESNFLHFLSLEWYHLHIWGCWCFSWLSWFQLVTHPANHFSWCAQHIG